MMKSPVILTLLAALIAVPALGQDDDRPDYSRDSLQRFVMTIPEEPERERNVRFYIGGIEFRALGSNWRLLSPMLPFSGTAFTTNRELPDPFSLTQTSVATSMRVWRTQRQRDAEMRRIEKTERAKVKVKVKAQ